MNRMVRSMVAAGTLLVLLAGIVGTAEAVPTKLTVHVISKGAKFVGTSMIGARVVVQDVRTGDVLADGITEGSTGNTERIMKQAHKRGTPLSTPDAAQFTTTLDLERPRKIRVTAHGPLAQEQSANTVSLTQWMLPGRHITEGDALLLELPGFVVDVLQPPAHRKLSGTPQTLTIRANVTMMCGCPIVPGGLWDADRYEIRARLEKGEELVDSTNLRYSGNPSQFEGSLTVPEPGTYRIAVFSFDPENGNTGLDWTTVVVSK